MNRNPEGKERAFCACEVITWVAVPGMDRVLSVHSHFNKHVQIPVAFRVWDLHLQSVRARSLYVVFADCSQNVLWTLAPVSNLLEYRY